MSDAPEMTAKKFCQLWAAAFSRALTSLGAVSVVAEPSEPVSSPAPSAEEFEKLVCSRFVAAGALKGDMLLVTEKPAALQFAQLRLGEVSNPDVEFSADKSDAYADFLRQVATQAAEAWKTQFGTEVSLTLQDSVGPEAVTAVMSNLRLTGEKLAEVTLRLFLEEALCTAIAAATQPAPKAEPKEQKPEIEQPASPPPAERATPLPANLGLVLDVELEATIRFGEREMLLRDIFGLIAGAVVELNQLVNEPADLLVAGRLVGRGEVVVVDGNFGLRVTEVASVSERAAAIQI